MIIASLVASSGNAIAKLNGFLPRIEGFRMQMRTQQRCRFNYEFPLAIYLTRPLSYVYVSVI